MTSPSLKDSLRAPTRVLIVDDSALYRRIMIKSVESLQEPVEVETASLGGLALKKIPAFRPDIVLLDMEMPEMSGIEVLKTIRGNFPEVMVILVSGVNSRSADLTIEGLSAGAADFIPKPDGDSPEQNISELTRRVKDAFSLASTRRFAQAARKALGSDTGTEPTPRSTPARKAPALIPPRVEVVGIGISTGGPSALDTMVRKISQAISVPIVIVQHMPPLFTESLAKALNGICPLPVSEALDNETLQAGRIYIAPGGLHVVVRKRKADDTTTLVLHFNDGPPVNSCKPSVDVLFQSLAEATSQRTLAVIMTGMGQDGLAGVQKIKDAGGYCLTQNEETCTIYGMPHAVDEANLSDESLPLGAIAERIMAIAH